MCGLLENIVRTVRIIHVGPTFRHKMAAANEVVNGDYFGFSLVITSAASALNNMHAGCQLEIRETEWCKPFYVCKWAGNQAKLGRRSKITRT
jgi:hypothetical protein